MGSIDCMTKINVKISKVKVLINEKIIMII